MGILVSSESGKSGAGRTWFEMKSHRRWRQAAAGEPTTARKTENDFMSRLFYAVLSR
jgi:hypothetical protein